MASKSPGSRSLGAIVDGRYSLVKVLGSGAMGVVYLARDLNLDRPLALKLIARELAQDPTTIARFKREAQALATIKHPNVVHVYSYGPHDGAYFFAMELIDGETVDQLMNHFNQRVPRDQVHSILRAVASGLGAVHAKGLVHRDVKPGNIVIEYATLRPVLVDFGLAANIRPTDGRTSFVGGTPYYMAPEQISAGEDGAIPPGPTADQYALACMAFELLTGRPPFDAQSVTAILAGHVNRPPPLLSATNPELAAIDAAMQKAMAKRPEDRFESCEAFIAALEPGFGKRTAPVLATPTPHPTHARLLLAETSASSDPNLTLDPAALQASVPKTSSSWLILLGAAVVALAGTLGFAAVRSHDAPANAITTPVESLVPSATVSAVAIPPPPPTASAIDVSSLPVATTVRPPTARLPQNSAVSHASAIPAATAAAPPPTTTKPAGAYDDFGGRK
ncbi:MAG: protein kinase [Polyangiaceae bacterium]